MFQGLYNKKVVIVPAGLALVLLLAVYGLTGQEKPDSKPVTNQVVHSKTQAKESFLNADNRKEVKYSKLQPEEDSDFQSTTLVDDITAQTAHKKPKKNDNSRDSSKASVNSNNLKRQHNQFDMQSTTTAVTPESSSVPEEDIASLVNSVHLKAPGNPANVLEDKAKVINTTGVEDRFSARLQHYNQLCRTKHYANLRISKYIRSVYSALGNNRLQWCHIPKVATTFLSYVLHENTPAIKRQYLTRYSRSDRKSFFMVREPYSRLVSGFICKIVTTPSFWKRYGKGIVSNYRLDASKESERCGHDVSFPEFIKYFIKAQKTGRNKNKHFTPIHEQCAICRREYDYIVHLETLKPDLSYIFDSVNVKMAIDIRNTEREMFDKIKNVMKVRDETPSCFFPCQLLNTLWWSFQARGFISTEDKLPFNNVTCKTVTVKKLTELAISAYKQFTDKEKRSKQKREMMAELYLQVPLVDRLKIRNILWKDFQLFQYNELEPRDIFPELFSEK